MGRIGELYAEHFFGSSRRHRLLLSTIGFVLAFAIARLITHAIKNGVGPFQNVETGGGGHVHHLVWGILLLLGVGYLWLLRVGTGGEGGSRWWSAITAFLYGVGSALTLDEFALWFNLADVYWLEQGRESVDAVVIFGSLLFAGVLAGPFLGAVGREYLGGGQPSPQG
jgi:hypothetical protein